MEVNREIRIQAPVNQVWKIAAEEYDRVGEWASAVQKSSPRLGGKPFPGAAVTGRVCETDLGPFTETIERFDPVEKKLVYSASGAKMPFFVRKMVGSWHLSGNENSTHVRFSLNADLMFPFSALMGGIMKKQFTKVIGETLEDLKTFAESGVVHERKQRSLKSVA